MSDPNLQQVHSAKLDRLGASRGSFDRRGWVTSGEPSPGGCRGRSRGMRASEAAYHDHSDPCEARSKLAAALEMLHVYLFDPLILVFTVTR
jgi:hypothetical protein